MSGLKGKDRTKGPYNNKTENSLANRLQVWRTSSPDEWVMASFEIAARAMENTLKQIRTQLEEGESINPEKTINKITKTFNVN